MQPTSVGLLGLITSAGVSQPEAGTCALHLDLQKFTRPQLFALTESDCSFVLGVLKEGGLLGGDAMRVIALLRRGDGGESAPAKPPVSVNVPPSPQQAVQGRPFVVVVHVGNKQVVHPTVYNVAPSATYYDVARGALEGAKVDFPDCMPMVADLRSSAANSASARAADLGSCVASLPTEFSRVTLRFEAPVALASTSVRECAFTSMMHGRSNHLPRPHECPEREALPVHRELYNGVLSNFKHLGLGVSHSEVDGCKSLAVATANALGLMLGRTEFPKGKMPSPFNDFFGIPKSKKPHKKLTQENMDVAASALDNCLSGSWSFTRSERWASALKDVEVLRDMLQAARAGLQSSNDKRERRRGALSFDAGSASVDAMTTRLVEPNESGTPPRYAAIEAKLTSLGPYEVAEVTSEDIHRELTGPKAPSDPHNYMAANRFRSGMCFNKIRYRHCDCRFGQGRKVVRFMWVVPEEADENLDARCVAKAASSLKRHASRAAVNDFVQEFSHLGSMPTAVMRRMYAVASGTTVVSKDKREAAMDQRTVVFCQQKGRMDLWPDLRAHNGNSGDKYNDFWEECIKYVEDLPKAAPINRHAPPEVRGTGSLEIDVDQNRFLAAPVSFSDLVRQVAARLHAKSGKEGSPIPSADWVCFQFESPEPYSAVGQRYTGRFKLKRKVQCKTLRCHHLDGYYNNVLNVYCKNFIHEYLQLLRSALGHKNVEGMVRVVSLDDKHKMTTGEPGKPISTGVRNHSKTGAIVSSDAHKNSMDHDWHKTTMTPTVGLLSDLIDTRGYSWRRGELFVSLKDSVMEGASSLISLQLRCHLFVAPV